MLDASPEAQQECGVSGCMKITAALSGVPAATSSTRCPHLSCRQRGAGCHCLGACAASLFTIRFRVPPYTMRMRLMLLGGGNALGQALIRLGAEEDIGFLAPRPPEQGWDAASLTTLLDETRPDAVINLAFYHDWFQAEQVEAERLAPRSAPSSASRSSASTTRSCWSSRPATGSSTAPAPPPTARRTRPFRWACVARRSGAWSRACARPARDMC